MKPVRTNASDYLLHLVTLQRLWNLPAGWRYGLALAIAAAATALRWALSPWMGSVAVYNITLGSVAVTAALFGRGPGLLSLFGGVVGLELFVLGLLPGAWGTGTWVRLVTTAVVGVLLCWILHAVREAQIRALRNEARLAAFGAATFEGIVETKGGQIVDYNEQFAQMVGRSMTELEGMAVENLVTPEDRERVLGNIRANRESVTEHGIVRKDGTRLTVEACGRPGTGGCATRRFATSRNASAPKTRCERARHDIGCWRIRCYRA